MHRALKSSLSLLFVGGAVVTLFGAGCGSDRSKTVGTTGAPEAGDTAWTFEKTIAEPILAKKSLGSGPFIHMR